MKRVLRIGAFNVRHATRKITIVHLCTLMREEKPDALFISETGMQQDS